MTLKSRSSGFCLVLRKQIETKEAKRFNHSDTEASFPPPVPDGKWNCERHRKTIIWRQAASEKGGKICPKSRRRATEIRFIIHQLRFSRTARVGRRVRNQIESRNKTQPTGNRTVNFFFFFFKFPKGKYSSYAEKRTRSLFPRFQMHGPVQTV